MNGILQWQPIIWTVRIGLLILVGGGAYLFVLLIARFFRWTNIRTMVLAELPRVESVGGEFAGAKAELKLSQGSNETQIAMMQERLEGFRRELDQILASEARSTGEEGREA